MALINLPLTEREEALMLQAFGAGFTYGYYYEVPPIPKPFPTREQMFEEWLKEASGSSVGGSDQ